MIAGISINVTHPLRVFQQFQDFIMSSALESLSPDEKKKLDQFMEAAKRQLQEADDIRGSLRDTAKGLADEFGIKPKELMIAARTAFKNDLEAKKDSMDTVIDILNITGHG
jgi:hypothetical protein